MHVNLSLCVPRCAQCLWPISLVCLQKLICGSQLPSESSDRKELPVIEHCLVLNFVLCFKRISSCIEFRYKSKADNLIMDFIIFSKMGDINGY